MQAHRLARVVSGLMVADAAFRAPIVALACVALSVVMCLAAPDAALAANAVRTPANFNSNAIPRGDDTYSSVVNLPFTMNWNGTVYNTIYINMNGNCTFGNFYTAYNPTTALGSLNRDILAPFWADVDTTNPGSAQVTYSNISSGSVPQVDGHNAFMVNWIGVPRYNAQTAPLNSFQLVLIDRSDTGAGNFDVEYNYDTITWDRGTAASTAYARAGWGRAGPTGYEVTGGNTNGAYLDTGASALVDGSLNSGGVLGRYVWSVRNGVPPNSPPLINLGFATRSLEANGPTGYAGYSGAGDATATDPDGSVASFVRTPAAGAFLPMGSTTVTWTATDNGGLVSVATQTVTVSDTTAPTLPALWCLSHAPSTWSGLGAITMDWTDSTDAASGLAGYSFGFTQGAAGQPDTTLDGGFTSVGASSPSLENQTFAVAAFPADWSRPPGDSQTYLVANNAAGRNHGTYAAETWTNANGTRRNVQFSKTFNLSGYTAATLSFWDYSVQIEAGDLNRVEYTTDGTNWITLQTRSTNAGWTLRTYPVPTGSSTVTIRFSGSVDRTNEYVCWDDIALSATLPAHNSITQAPGDGVWYFNIRAVDNAANWSATTSRGPFWIESFPPTTSSNITGAWQNAPFTVVLTATDLGSGVQSTTYRVDGGAWTPYGGSFVYAVQGSHLFEYFSADNAAHVETVRSDTLRIDLDPPSAPAAVVASPADTRTADIGWDASTDAVSGVDYYSVYLDGSLAGTTTATSYTATGLTPGRAYTVRVSATDRASNESARSAPATVDMPQSTLWLTVSQPTVAFPPLVPGLPVTLPDATTVSVNGVGAVDYDLSCSAPDFVDTGLGTLSFPVGSLEFVTKGWRALSQRPMSVSDAIVDSSTGSNRVWRHDYTFDYVLNVPWTAPPADYATNVVYTVVLR